MNNTSSVKIIKKCCIFQDCEDDDCWLMLLLYLATNKKYDCFDIFVISPDPEFHLKLTLQLFRTFQQIKNPKEYKLNDGKVICPQNLKIYMAAKYNNKEGVVDMNNTDYIIGLNNVFTEKGSNVDIFMATTCYPFMKHWRSEWYASIDKLYVMGGLSKQLNEKDDISSLDIKTTYGFNWRVGFDAVESFMQKFSEKAIFIEPRFYRPMFKNHKLISICEETMPVLISLIAQSNLDCIKLIREHTKRRNQNILANNEAMIKYLPNKENLEFYFGPADFLLAYVSIWTDSNAYELDEIPVKGQKYVVKTFKNIDLEQFELDLIGFIEHLLVFESNIYDEITEDSILVNVDPDKIIQDDENIIDKVIDEEELHPIEKLRKFEGEYHGKTNQ